MIVELSNPFLLMLTEDNIGEVSDFVQKNPEEEFDEIFYDSSHIEVPYPGYEISERPMFSRGYEDCNAVVLLDGKAGLSHFNLREHNPEEHLTEMIEEMKNKNDVRDIRGVLVGGKTAHLLWDMEILNDHDIPIENIYSDREFRNNFHQVPCENYNNKDMVVIPNKGKVIIYDEIKGYEQLTSNKKTPNLLRK